MYSYALGVTGCIYRVFILEIVFYTQYINDKSPCLQGLTFFLSYAILAAVLGMLQFGYNTGVINAPEVVRLST